MASDQRENPSGSRKREIRDLADRYAPERRSWRNRNSYYYGLDTDYMRFLVSPGQRVLDLGCGMGDLLAALEPSHGVGVDFSEVSVRHARKNHPDLEFHLGDIENPEVLQKLEGTFDTIILSDTIGYLEDVQVMLESLHSLCHRRTRIVVAYYSNFWEPLLQVGEWLRMKMPGSEMNFLPTADIENLLDLAGFGVVKRDWQQLIPRSLFGLGSLVNNSIATLPLVRRLCLRTYVVARSLHRAFEPPQSCSILIPCRNERGNIEPAIQRLPAFCDDMEILYVEGHSTDGTFEEAERVQKAYPHLDIKVMQQDGVGKGDAVRKGLSALRGDAWMILDADLTVPPEQLPKFWKALCEGRGELVQGSRLIYPMEGQAMRLINLIGNHAFSRIFSWLLNQRITDTLCGTKVMRTDDYRELERNRAYFGDFDPFGDFDLIFGASKMNLQITEIPIRYQDRSYGETQISRWRHGLLLIRMVVFAFRKLKMA
ncbi:MAG: glycosyltransferase [bacterium]|nr:glycosyltransferase [bacterium]MCP5065871.1 glycosyltransferase [bacterium]